MSSMPAYSPSGAFSYQGHIYNPSDAKFIVVSPLLHHSDNKFPLADWRCIWSIQQHIPLSLIGVVAFVNPFIILFSPSIHGGYYLCIVD